MKDNRYIMGWSQAYASYIVVYAPSLEDAEEKFENGEFVYEQ